MWGWLKINWSDAGRSRRDFIGGIPIVRDERTPYGMAFLLPRSR